MAKAEKAEMYWQSRLMRLERRMEYLEARLNAKAVDPNNDSDYYTVKEMAAALNVNRLTVIRRIEQGKLIGYKIGKAWRIPKSELKGIFE